MATCCIVYESDGEDNVDWLLVAGCGRRQEAPLARRQSRRKSGLRSSDYVLTRQLETEPSSFNITGLRLVIIMRKINGMETSVSFRGTSGFWVQAFSVLLCAYFSKISMKFMRNYITRAWTGGRDYCYVEPNLPEKKEGMVLNMLGGAPFPVLP